MSPLGTVDSSPCPALTGVWRRHGLALDDAPAVEDSCVVWLQAGPYFADMRTPLADSSAPATAFCGRSMWAAPVMTFHRDLDLAVPPRADSGHLRFADGQLIEDGTFTRDGRTIRYREFWTRTDHTPSRRLVLDAVTKTSSRRYVEVDGHAMMMVDDRAMGGAFLATHFVEEGGRWHGARHLDDGNALAAPIIDDPAATQTVLSFPNLAPPWSDTLWRVQWRDLPGEGAQHG